MNKSRGERAHFKYCGPSREYVRQTVAITYSYPCYVCDMQIKGKYNLHNYYMMHYLAAVVLSDIIIQCRIRVPIYKYNM